MSMRAPKKQHIAEILLSAKLHGKEDRFRKRRPFSEDIAGTQAILFNAHYDKRRKIRAYRTWLEINQPCVFGRMASRNKNVFICLLEEHEILSMKRGDDDLRDTIQDYRQAWKRHALEGLSSSFLIVLVSETLVTKEPNDQLKEICRRLMELYMEMRIGDDTVHAQREYVFLRNRNSARILKFSTLPNVFCAQADGRWWHDHRTPGGIMITSNALGHFIYSRMGKAALGDAEKVWALELAMRTIGNAYRGPAGRKSPKLRHCPATFLVPAKEGESSPLQATSDLRKYSADYYHGYFHTDHLIPSVFFRPDQDPATLQLYDKLDFRYIHNPQADPDEHAELITGIEVKSWYEVKRSMDRLPEYADPEHSPGFPPPVRTKVADWLERRLRDRIGG